MVDCLEARADDDVASEADVGRCAGGGDGKKLFTDLGVEQGNTIHCCQKRRDDSGVFGTEVLQHEVRAAGEGGAPVVHVNPQVHDMISVGGGGR